MEDGRPGRGERSPERRFELVVLVDPSPKGAVPLRDADPVHRPEVRGHRLEAAANLVVVDRAVAFVVEDQHDRVDADTDGGLQLRDGHPCSAVPGKGHDRPSRSGQRRRDGGRDREPHRASRRAHERARSPHDQAAGGPAAEVASVRRDDRVGRENAVERGHDPARMHARPVPGCLIDPAGVLVCGPIGGHRGTPPLQARCVEHARTEDASRFPQERACVGRERDGRRVEPGPRSERLRIHVRPSRPGSRNRVAVRGDLVQAAADHEDRIGILQPAADRRSGEVAAHPEVAGVVVREDVRAAPCRDDRDVHELGQADQIGCRARAQDATAGEDDRPLRVEQKVEDPAHVDGIGRWGAGWPRRRRAPGPHRRVGDLLGQEVLRQGEEHGARPAGRGAPNCLVEDRRQRSHVADLACPAAEPPDGCRQVCLLEPFAPAGRPRHLAGQRDDRKRIRVGNVEADGQVRRPDRPRPKDHRRVAAECRRGGGHERGSSLVTGCHDPDPGGRQTVQEGQEALSRNGVGDPHSGRGERVGDKAAGCPRCRGHGLPFPSGSW